MTRHTYRPIEEAPRDGTPIIGVCGGVECCVVWHGGCEWVPRGWYHGDEYYMASTTTIVDPQPDRWRKLF